MNEQIAQIIERNKRVEMDKAWETSVTRRAIIAGITYLTACIFLWQVGIESYYLSALVPTGGYILSTLSIPWAKKWWVRSRKDMDTNS